MVVSARVGTGVGPYRAFTTSFDNAGVLAVAPPPRVALVPNAIAFRDPQHGIMGTGWQGCTNIQFGCKPQGTVSVTTNGGRTWRVILRTPRPVVAVGYSGALLETARYDDGENVGTVDGRHWTTLKTQPTSGGPCPPGWRAFASYVWVLCAGPAGAGNETKSLYERGKRIAYAPFPSSGAYGGISPYGYPQGISMAGDFLFGLIWEWRGTLYVTRDGGDHWVGLPKVAEPEADFGMSGAALPHGVGFVVLARGGSEVRRLIETTDAGRSWVVVHRWK
jgi:hypothetical protein